MFVIKPDLFCMPSYRISPFTTADLSANAKMSKDEFAVDYCNRRFGAGNWCYTFNGREAIALALQQYELKPDDIVTIITTSQNFYISSCVTKTIEKFCHWNREILPSTKLILVNHEFGYPYPDMEQLVATGLPIIEDCCTTFFSQNTIKKIGHYGDFSVYSFPKFFPIQIGGLLVSNAKEPFEVDSQLSEDEVAHIENVFSYHLRQEKSILAARKERYEYAVALFATIGLTPRFDQNESVVPSALVLRNNEVIRDLNALKTFLNEHGIQNSVFYGEDAFFIPIHQNLSTTDLDYIFAVICYFISN
jgi:dTDP-4-amino-4,6-dideoxygalactose transaminase